MYKGYNTFYEEFLNNTFSNTFTLTSQLNYESYIRCITPNAQKEKNYYIKQNIKNDLDKNISIPDGKEVFAYYYDKNNVTFLKKPNILLNFKIYNMKSLLPEIIIPYSIQDQELMKVLTNSEK